MSHRASSRAAVALATMLLTAQAAVASDPADVEVVLAEYESEAALNSFLGPRFEACVTATTTTRLCEWILGSRESGWRALAKVLGTKDRVGVLCELPDGQADDVRKPGTCAGYARRSNRGSYDVSRRHARTGADKQRRKRELEAHRARARAELAAARTLLSLSRLLGSKPGRCTVEAGQTQRCTWRLSNHTRGHGTVAASIGADLAKKVRLECDLPVDGGERGSDSCHGQVGS